MRVINITQGSDLWHEWRQNGIGASDIAAIMGVCPYRKAEDVYNDKKGLSKPRSNSAMARGTKFEPEARRVFNRGREHSFEPILCEHEVVTFARASLDGYCAFNRQLVEIKIPSRQVLDMARYGQVPIHYLYQMQWQFMVSDAVKGFFFCYNPESLESYTVEVFPDIELMEKLSERAVAFWMDYVVKDIPPKDKSDKKTVNEATRDYLIEMAQIKERMVEDEKRYEYLRKTVLELEGTDISLECDKYILQRSERESVDYKQAALDAGVDLQRYKKPVTVYWTFKAKG